MKLKRRGFELTVERSQTIFTRESTTESRWCSSCGRDVQMLPPDVAAKSARMTSRELFRLIEADRIHFTETQAGYVLVCRESLSREE